MANIFVFVFGAVLGSFLNVCIYRLPKGKSVVWPPSACPKCNTPIRWYDNIPLVSYLILRGRCRACRATISARYFLVEILTAALMLSLFVIFGPGAKFFSYAILVSGLIVATFVDFEIQEIPDEVSLLGLAAGLIIGLVFPGIFGEVSRWKGILGAALGALVGGGTIYLMGFVGEIVFKKEAMGGGDVKLMAMIGSFLGWKLVVFVFFAAPIFGSIAGIIMKIRKGSETIPYGPYLSLAAVVAIFLGERILSLLFYGIY